ncbi:hypothetical protein GCM10027343_24980 [Noviherbaspirillum agri]
MKFKKALSKQGIGSYLAAAFSGLTILLTLILSEVIGLTASEQVKTNIGNGLAELALQTSDKLDRGMFERYREVQLMAKRHDLTSPSIQAEEKRAILDARQETYHYYAWIGLVTPEGKVTAATQKMLEGADVSQRPWFRNALSGVYVGDVHEAVLLAKLLPQIDGEPKRFVDIAFPYLDAQGRIEGVLGVHLSWQWAREVEQSVMTPVRARRQVEAMIVGTDGTVLLGPPDVQGKKVGQVSFKAASANSSGYLVEEWQDGTSYLVGYSRTTGYGTYKGLGWTIFVRQSVEDAYLPVRRIQQRVLWSGIGLAVLFSLFGFLAARRIVKPLAEVADLAQRIQHGEALEITAAKSGYAEVQALTGSLDALVSRLLQRKAELTELNQSLEQRVEERTRELQRALAAVRANEKRIQAIIESAQDAYLAVDLKGRITDWNSAAQRMFGWTSSEAVGRPMTELIVPERFRKGVISAMHHFNETGHVDFINRRLERIVINRDGKEIPVEVSIALAGTHEAYFFSTFLHDISERKEIERMKNEFVSTVSHELRTPMTSIRASLAMLADGSAGELPPDTRVLIDIAYGSCERLVRLVNDVLDIEKIESGSMMFDMQPQLLLPIVQQAMDAVDGSAVQHRVVLDLHAEQDRIQVMADQDRMIQVVVNLLSNAIKFSPPDSTVTVRIGSDGERATVSVVDQGPGIPEEFSARIFQKFAQADSTNTRQKGGSGLGLSICKSIVAEHGGTIGFTSEAGKGATFTVTLPLAA